MSEPDDVRAQALEVAAGWSPPDAPESWRLTAALFLAIAGHDRLLAALAGLPAGRLPALLASAAISFLVQRDRPVPLAASFPEPGRPQPPFAAGFAAAAAEFISAHLDEIVVICRTRRYQMNEVARCAQIAAGLCAIAAPPEPVALIDIGTGAGLGLQLDRYRFVIGGRELGSPAARLSLSCAALGRLAPPVTALPPISSATGIELSPVDLQDPAARAWLAACAPPEASALTRLAAATEITRSDPRPVVAGDAVDELPAVLASLPPGQHAVVTDAYVAVFLPPGRRRLLAAALAAASHSRRVTWLSLDPLVPFGPGGRDSVQGLPLPAPLVRDYQRSGVFAVLGAVTFAGGARQERSGRLLARAHPSGQWMEWLDVT